MIDVKELMIDNLLQYEDLDDHVNYKRVDGLLMERLWLDKDKDYYEPIELTEDILIKCGFERYTENTGPINEEIEYWCNYVLHVFFDAYGALVIKDYHVNINRPRYLHQLQNLYYALTNEELEITL